MFISMSKTTIFYYFNTGFQYSKYLRYIIVCLVFSLIPSQTIASTLSNLCFKQLLRLRKRFKTEEKELTIYLLAIRYLRRNPKKSPFFNRKLLKLL